MPPLVGAVSREWERLQVTALASQIAFSAVFALPPLLVCVMAIASMVNTYTGIPVADWLREQIEHRAPVQIRELLIFIVDEAIAQTSGGLASIGAIVAAGVAVYSASGVVNAVVNASNRAFGVPDRRNFVVKRTFSIALMFGLSGLLIVIGVLSIGLESWISRQLLGSELGGWLWSLLRLPISIALLAAALVILYSVGLVANPPLLWTLPGATLASVAIQVAVWAYGNVLGVINPGSPYGATGSVLVLLSFLYAMGIILILGAAINGMFFRWRSGRSALLHQAVPAPDDLARSGWPSPTQGETGDNGNGRV